MGLDVGGFNQKPDWPKLGPSLLIASCLILAIRTATWPARAQGGTGSDRSLDEEIEHAIHVAGRVLASLVVASPEPFAQKAEPWFMPNDDDVPK